MLRGSLSTIVQALTLVGLLSLQAGCDKRASTGDVDALIARMSEVEGEIKAQIEARNTAITAAIDGPLANAACPEGVVLRGAGADAPVRNVFFAEPTTIGQAGSARAVSGGFVAVRKRLEKGDVTAEALALERKTVEDAADPARAPFDIILVTTRREDPTIQGSTYGAGSWTGRAFVWSHASNSIACAAEATATLTGDKYVSKGDQAEVQLRRDLANAACKSALDALGVGEQDCDLDSTPF